MGMTKGNIWAFWDGGMRRNRERQRSKDKKKKKVRKRKKESCRDKYVFIKSPVFLPL